MNLISVNVWAKNIFNSGISEYCIENIFITPESVNITKKNILNSRIDEYQKIDIPDSSINEY
jgi:hypothetical protein